MSNYLSIFTKDDWKNLYPRESYQLATKELPADADNTTKETVSYVKEHLIHFLIALDQPVALIVSQIESIAKKTTPAQLAKLTKADSKHYNWTPLHLAVIKGQEPIVAAFVAIKSVRDAIDARDIYGWSPLHHAAIPAEHAVAISNQLLHAGADHRAVNNLRGSCDDLKALLAVSNTLPDWTKTVLFNGNPITPAVVQERFDGIQFRDRHLFKDAKSLWMQPPNDIEDSFTENGILNALKLPLKQFNIFQVSHDGKLLDNFYGLEAGENLKAGDFVGAYVGTYAEITPAGKFKDRFTAEQKQTASYLFYHADAKTVRNHTAFVNEGFPNVSTYETDIRGVTRGCYYMVSDDLPKGSELLVNYGGEHFISFGPQLLLGKEAMTRFFKPGFNAILARREQDNNEIGRIFQMQPNQQKKITLKDLAPILRKGLVTDRLYYPLQHPIAMLYLHFSGTLPIKEWNDLIHYRNKSASKNPCYPVIQDFMATFAFALDCISLTELLHQSDQKIAKSGSENHAFFTSWFLTHLEKESVMNLSKVIEWMTEELTREPRTLSNEQFASQIEEKLKTYDWTQDVSNLYSYERRKLRRDDYFNHLTEEAMLRFGKEHDFDFDDVKIEIIFHYVQEMLKKTPFEKCGESFHLINDLGRELSEKRATKKGGSLSSSSVNLE